MEDHSVAANVEPPAQCSPPQPVADGQENAHPSHPVTASVAKAVPAEATTPGPSNGKGPKPTALAKRHSTANLAATVDVQTNAISDLETKVVSYQCTMIDHITALAHNVTTNFGTLTTKIDAAFHTSQALSTRVDDLATDIQNLRAHVDASSTLVPQYAQQLSDTGAAMEALRASAVDESTSLREELKEVHDAMECEANNVRNEIFALAQRMASIEDVQQFQSNNIETVVSNNERLTTHVENLSHVVCNRPQSKSHHHSYPPSEAGASTEQHLPKPGEESHPIEIIDSDEDSWRPASEPDAESEREPTSPLPRPTASPSKHPQTHAPHAATSKPTQGDVAGNRDSPDKGKRVIRDHGVHHQPPPSIDDRPPSSFVINTMHSKRPNTADIKVTPPKRNRQTYTQRPRRHAGGDDSQPPTPSPPQKRSHRPEVLHHQPPIPTGAIPPRATRTDSNTHIPTAPVSEAPASTAQTVEDNSDLVELTTDEVVIKKLAAFMMVCEGRPMWGEDRKTNHLTLKSINDLWKETSPPGPSVTPVANIHVSAYATIFICRNPTECWTYVHEFRTRPPGLQSIKLVEPPQMEQPQEVAGTSQHPAGASETDFLAEALARTRAARAMNAPRGGFRQGRGRGGARMGVF